MLSRETVWAPRKALLQSVTSQVGLPRYNIYPLSVIKISLCSLASWYFSWWTQWWNPNPIIQQIRWWMRINSSNPMIFTWRYSTRVSSLVVVNASTKITKTIHQISFCIPMISLRYPQWFPSSSCWNLLVGYYLCYLNRPIFSISTKFSQICDV